MKKTAVNIMACTGITLVILAVIAAFSGARNLFISSVFQSFGANILINLGLLLTRRFESKYTALEATLDISYTIIILIMFGSVFDWFANGTPIWILVIMAVIIYLIGLFLSMFRMQENLAAINKLLQKRKQKLNSQEI